MGKKYNVTFKKQIAEGPDRRYVNPQIGKAYEAQNGHIDVLISSIPINWNGKMRLWLEQDSVEDEEKEEIEE